MTEINLSLGSSSFNSPAPALQAAIDALQNNKTFYGPAEGTATLRQSIVDRYTQEGISIKPEQVLVTPGTKQALFNLLSILLQPGDEIIVPTPAWFGFHELIKYSPGKLVTLPTTASDNYSINEADLRKAITPKTRLILLTNPANPTGGLFSRTEIEAILRVLEEHPNVYFICDEIYDLYTYDSTFTSALACTGPQERVIVVNGFSKTFAMSGWRVGYIIAPEDVISKATAFQSGTYSGVSVFIQDAAEAAMRHRAEGLQMMLATLESRRQLTQEKLQAIPNIAFKLPEGAYYFFPDLSYYIGSTTTSGTTINSTADLCTYLQNEYKLVVANGDNFGGKGHVRISFAVEETELVEAMHRLKNALSKLTVREV